MTRLVGVLPGRPAVPAEPEPAAQTATVALPARRQRYEGHEGEDEYGDPEYAEDVNIQEFVDGGCVRGVGGDGGVVGYGPGVRGHPGAATDR